MTIQEKVAQMRIFHARAGVGWSKNGKLTLNKEVQKYLRNGIAGIKNPGERQTPEESARLTNELQRTIIENSRLKIPALFITEAYNGIDANGTTQLWSPY